MTPFSAPQTLASPVAFQPVRFWPLKSDLKPLGGSSARTAGEKKRTSANSSIRFMGLLLDVGLSIRPSPFALANKKTLGRSNSGVHFSFCFISSVSVIRDNTAPPRTFTNSGGSRSARIASRRHRAGPGLFSGRNRRPARASACPSARVLRLLHAGAMLCFMSDVTRILSAIDQGDPAAAEQLLPLVYDELRKLAAAKLHQERPGQTFQATALVHEAYLRLVDVDQAQHWNSRGHFFAAAAEAMRRILINRARDKGRLKRGGGCRRVNLDDLADPVSAPADDLLDLDEALDALAVSYPQAAELVKLRFFVGLTLMKAAEALGLPPRTAARHWAFARAWLIEALGAP